MKKILFLLFAVMFTAFVTEAKSKAEIKFEAVSHDFGTIRANGGKVTATYKFTNTGDKPLVIVSVSNGGCGCTVPSYPKMPVQPGKEGEISITFDPRGRSGEFERVVKVKTNAGNSRQKLTFSGTIIP
ncbi:MAG: DUF1573 domain-containing protein [Duncaniella sp.]|nr:DUF1573 domain-containing protein [Duncaniella sp.]